MSAEALEQGEHLKRRDEILAEFGVRADQSNKGGTGKYADVTGDKLTPVKTTADIASGVGLSERAAQRRKQAADLPEPVRDALRDTPVADEPVDSRRSSGVAEHGGRQAGGPGGRSSN